MIVIAHRGANREAPENSMEAFHKAIDGGAERLELDVQMSVDGQLFVVHDDDLRKGSVLKSSQIVEMGHLNPLKISSMVATDLETLRLTNDETIPTLSRVFREIPDEIELNIEIKGLSWQTAAAVSQLIQREKPANPIIISCFYAPPLLWLNRQAPHMATACLWGRDNLRWPDFAMYSPQLFMDTCYCKIIHPEAKMVDENFMDQARHYNWQVYTWSAMDGEEIDRYGLWTNLMTLGVDGHCTNYPRQFYSWLRGEALYESKE
jgi:glycerophosphoryl diester phosphodiesterase